MAKRANPITRGIDVVRNKIKVFAQKKVTLPPGRHKIIILDEADRSAVRFQNRKSNDGRVA
jgi:DNA polymerase III delta prime subunit